MAAHSSSNFKGLVKLLFLAEIEMKRIPSDCCVGGFGCLVEILDSGEECQVFTFDLGVPNLIKFT